MRILRLALRHYRGVVEREVELAPHGVTLIQGPNEVGKSSLAEATLLLFDELDNTSKRQVREIQPVDRDEGSEVEADIELGPYLFTYTKRFHRKPSTHLTIREPEALTLTGREAHERVRALLDEYLDVALWRALRLQQGAPLDAPELDGSSSLAAALDRAAGVRGGGEREESLFDAARAAFEVHYTPTGRPRRELRDAEAAVSEAVEEERVRRERLDALERDIETEASLRREVAELEGQVAAGRLALRNLEEELEGVERLRERLARLSAQREAARAEEDAAIQAARQRGQLVSAYAGASAELESLAEALEGEEPALVAASAELRHVEERLEAAREARANADSVEQQARRDAALLRGEREAAELRERMERVEREREGLDRAREVLAGPTIDRARVVEIQTAQLEVERAQTRLDTQGPSVRIEPEVDLEILVDGRRERLVAGEANERSVAEALVLSLPGVGEVTVVAGAGVAEQRKLLEQARTRLRTLCVESGVEDHAGAVAVLAARGAAEEELERGRERMERALAGVSPADLSHKHEELEARTARERAACSHHHALPETLEDALAILARSEAAATAARAEAEDLSGRRDAAAARFTHHDRRCSETRTRLELCERNRADLGSRLFEARSETSDESLAERRRERADAARDLEAHTSEAERSLASLEPERLEARGAEQREALEGAERSHRERRETLLRIAERLEMAGAEGLFERWQEAVAQCERAEHTRAALERRALAARKLFEVLREERDAARSHYAAPLAEHMAELGRRLFGADFAVELGEDLRVEARILDGLRLGADQLSAGAREQLALLSRLAASRIAGGVPLWLDDALGHTDPERLDALGPLLAAAGEHTQVIVLTCSPERFRSVPDPHVIAL